MTTFDVGMKSGFSSIKNNPPFRRVRWYSIPQTSIKAINRIRTLDCFHPSAHFFFRKAATYYKPIWTPCFPVTAFDLRNVTGCWWRWIILWLTHFPCLTIIWFSIYLHRYPFNLISVEQQGQEDFRPSVLIGEREDAVRCNVSDGCRWKAKETSTKTRIDSLLCFMEQVKDWTLALIVREVLKGANIEEIQRRKKVAGGFKISSGFWRKGKE